MFEAVLNMFTDISLNTLYFGLMLCLLGGIFTFVFKL